MKPLLTKRDSLHGAIIYSLGDSCAALLTDEFQLSRLIGMMVLGGTLYAIEIPCYLAWIECRFNKQGISNGIKRALVAEAFLIPYGLPVILPSLTVFQDNLQLYSGI